MYTTTFYALVNGRLMPDFLHSVSVAVTVAVACSLPRERGHWGATPTLLRLVHPPDENSADGITCLRSSTIV